MKSVKAKWCIEQHDRVNHKYGDYSTYGFHLEMVYNVYENYKHLLDDKDDYYGNEFLGHREDPVTLRESCSIAVYAHDLMEDCRCTYNDVKNRLGPEVADIVYAVTNEKGKSRHERANDKYYEGIRNTKGATFVKLCDRIANVQYSKMTKSRMFETYKNENSNFLLKLGYFGNDSFEYEPMCWDLLSLFVD